MNMPTPTLKISGSVYAWVMEDDRIKVYGDTKDEAIRFYENAVRLEDEMDALAQRERKYHLVAVSERTGARTQLTSYPMSHHECMVNKSKFSQHPARRIVLEEVAA